MLPVEIVPVQDSIVLRARGSELLILPVHVKKLKTLSKPREFSQYFHDEALVNRPARKLFEAWLRKDNTVWPRLFQMVHKEMDLSESAGDEDAPKKAKKAEKVEAKPEKKAEKAEAKPEKKAEKAPEKKAEKVEKTTEKKAAAKPEKSTEKKAEKVEKSTEKKADKKDDKKTTKAEASAKPKAKAKPAAKKKG